MSGLRIAEVSRRTGVPASTLRYYEGIGLLAPASRSGNGYRAYSARDLDRLRFITRAKQLDLSLDDLRELLTAWDSEDCAEVQQRMAGVVSARLTQTRDRIVVLMELAAQLQVAMRRLAVATQPGGCDDGCACSTAASTVATTRATGPTDVPLTTRPPTPADPELREADDTPIACTLDRDLMRGRVDDWRGVLAHATGREPVPGGVALTFEHDPAVTVELARLAVAEHACCTFFDFTLAVSTDGVRLEVRAPHDARDLVATVFGVPGPAA